MLLLSKVLLGGYAKTPLLKHADKPKRYLKGFGAYAEKPNE